jgi:hypothetical protein
MTERRVFRITPTNRRHVAEQVANLPEGYVIKAGPPTRSLEQNALLHAMFGELEKKARYMGRQMTLNQWKTLMISGHAVATGLASDADIIPGIEREFVCIRESSAQMSVARMTSLIEYIQAWAADNNVQFNQN